MPTKSSSVILHTSNEASSAEFAPGTEKVAEKTVTWYKDKKVQGAPFLQPKKDLRSNKDRFKETIDQLTASEYRRLEEIVARSNLATTFGLSSAQSSADDQLPKSPPLLWINRDKGRGQKPKEFILEVYSPWIGKGLTSGKLKSLDPTLHNAYTRDATKDAGNVIPELPVKNRRSEADPNEELARQRAAKRKYYHKNKTI